jgi:hypothetical protein
LIASCISIAFVGALSSMARSDGAGADQPRCTHWEVEYELTGTLKISNTTFGAGDGSHMAGPGKLVLRFDDVNGQPGGNVTVVSYEMATRFTVDAKFLGIGTSVATDCLTKSTANACTAVAKGVLGDDRTIRWQGPWTGIRTDGTFNCSGTCGRFGAPPRGKSEMHKPTHSVAFSPFVFTASRTAFFMNYAVVDKTSNDTASLSFSGRETRRSCVCPPTCG